MNCYLLPEDPVTLVDPGMVIPESIARPVPFTATSRLKRTASRSDT